MTAELEYSYLNVESISKAVNEVMSRAVRVKSAVRDKLERLYGKNAVVVNNNIDAVPVTQVEPVNEPLMDLSEENMKLLNNKLNAMEVQGKVPYVSRRAVLFTKALVSKIEKVSSKWFKEMPRVEAVPSNVEPQVSAPSEPAVEPSVELPKVEITNHLGGEVVPGTWDDVDTKEEMPNLDFAVPTIEPVSVVNETPVPPVDEPVVPTELEMPAVEEPSIPSEPVAEPVPEVPQVEMSVEEQEPKAEAEYVNEPVPVAEEVPNEEFVKEPIELSNEEVSVEPSLEPVSQIEMPVEEPKVEPQTQHTESNMSIDDKISELLNRRPQEEQKEEVPNKEVSQNDIVYKLTRFKKENEDAKRKLVSVTHENEELKEKYESMKRKYEETKEILKGITKEQRRMTSDYDYLKGNYESAKRTIEELKEKHNEELNSLKRDQARQLREVNDANERKISAIYSTISEVLGETPSVDENDDYKRVA